MAIEVPVWVWLAGQTEPVHAANLTEDQGRYHFKYLEAYKATAACLALDPVNLRLKDGRGFNTDRLPGVIMDAKPAGYGQDRLNAHLSKQLGRDLTDLELLEHGPADGVGAIEVCFDIERKLQWQAKHIDQLMHELAKLEEDAPASRAIRKVNGDLGTSAGGERPKATFVHDERLWLVKMQDRGDRAGMPAMEYTAMLLASQSAIVVPPIMLKTEGPNQAFMIERFDRGSGPEKPPRRLFASAHTALNLPFAALRGDPRRSYLVLADQLRIWTRNNVDKTLVDKQLQELWRRMVFNALVGNVDDHPRNHGFLHDGQNWTLSPAFDITPAWRPLEEDKARPFSGIALAMATGPAGGEDASVARLLASAEHFGVALLDAAAYLHDTSARIATSWETTLRKALAPLGTAKSPAYIDQVVSDVRGSFAMSQALLDEPSHIDAALIELQRLQGKRTRGRKKDFF